MNNPFSGFFQGVGNLVGQGVTDVEHAFTPNPSPPPADGAVLEAAAAQAQHPQTKAALHKIAADTYSQMANQNSSAPSTDDPNYQNWLTGAIGTFAAPVQEGIAEYNIDTNPQVKAQRDAIRNNPDLSEDEKLSQLDDLYAKYGGQTASQSQAATDFAENVSMPGAEGVGELAPSAGMTVDSAVTGGKAAIQNAREALGGAADRISQGAQDIARNAAAQPGGFQAGFAKIGPGTAEAAGNGGDVKYLVQEALNNNDLEGAQKLWSELPDGDQYKEGMRSFFGKMQSSEPQLAGGEAPTAEGSATTQPTSQPLPEEPSGTSVQFNKDGTETIIPQDQRTNQAQYAQEAPPVDEQPAQTAEPSAQPVNDRASFQQNNPPPGNQPPGDEPPISAEATLPGGDPRQIPQRSVDILDNTYTVPAKKAMGSLQKNQTYRGMLSHIKSGMDPALLEQMPSLVSDSQTGMIPKMTREIADMIPGDLTITDPGAAAKKVMDQHKLFIDEKTQQDILSDITEALKAAGDNGGKGAFDGNDAVQYARELETRAAEARQGDTYLTMRGDRRYIAQALNAAADDVWDQIGQKVTPEMMAKVKTPERIAYLHSLSPRLAAQVQNAKDIPQLRTSIRDFVRMGQIVEQTDASSGSTFGKVGRLALSTRAGRLVKGAGIAAKVLTGNHAGAAVDIGKMAAAKAAGAMEESPRTQLLNSLQEEPGQSGSSARFADGSNPTGSGAKQGVRGRGMGKGMKVAATGVAGLSLLGGGMAIEHAINPSNADSGNPAGKGDDSHGVNISTSFTKNQDGSLSLPTFVSQPTGQYMTDSQRLAAESNLSLNNPVDKSQYDKIEAEYQNGQTRAKDALPGNSMEFMKNAGTYTAVGNVVQNDIKNLPTGFLNKFKTWSAVQAYYSDPKNPYAGELADLDTMNTQFSAAYNQINGVNPGANQLITAGDSTAQIQAKWTKMMNFIGDTYAQRLEPYQALTASQGAQQAGGSNIQGPTVQQTPAGAPDASAIVGGNAMPDPNHFTFQAGQSPFAP